MKLDAIDDVKRWWLTVEDEKETFSTDISISGREKLMNRDPEALRDLLRVRFDEAARKLREEFVKNA